MERHPRRTEPLVISDPLARLLGALRAATGGESPAELDVDRVRDIEATVGSRLPDPVLAILAAKIEPLVDELGLGLGEIPRHTRRAIEARARGDLIVFGVGPGGHVFHGFLIGADDDRIASYETRRSRLSSLDTVAWLRQQTEGSYSPLPSAEALEARLVRAAKPEPEGQRVLHAKWGVGRLLKEEGRGDRRKVKVAFPNIGLKTINARFVEFLDETES